MSRYARIIGSIVCGKESLNIWIVVRSDTPPGDCVPVSDDLSDDEVKRMYGVKVIHDSDFSQQTN